MHTSTTVHRMKTTKPSLNEELNTSRKTKQINRRISRKFKRSSVCFM